MITDYEFGDDIGSQDQAQMVKDAMKEVGLDVATLDPTKVDRFVQLVSRAGEDYFYAEHAGNAPGSRSGHRNQSIKWARLAKNLLRDFTGRRTHGHEERGELEQALLDFKASTPCDGMYDPKFLRPLEKMLVQKFGFNATIAYDVASAIDGSLDKQDPSAHDKEWLDDILQSAAIKLRSMRRTRKA